MKKIISILSLTAFALSALFTSCQKTNDYLPPDWAYDIPETPLKESANVGAFYTNRVDGDWAASIKDTPLLNFDEDGNPLGTTPEGKPVGYTTNIDGLLTQQCRWADEAGVDFFIFPWNNSQSHKDLIDIYLYYREADNTKVKVAFYFYFTHLSLDSDTKKLTDSGESFDKIVQEFKDMYATYFGQDFYYRLPDGRPVIIMPGTVSDNVDYSVFIAAFKEAMREHTEFLQETDPTVKDNALDFYIIGESTGNWLPPQRHEEASKYVDAVYVSEWYPDKYYERWYAFYSYTDMAWQNWRDYCSRWGNDFVPCIFPEYYVTKSSSRSIERSEKGYTDFCNVAKRNIGSNNVVLINSWNNFETGSALEPAEEYGETYLKLTRKNLKK